jgi:tetratricopeptide (TPR) repeat protein
LSFVLPMVFFATAALNSQQPVPPSKPPDPTAGGNAPSQSAPMSVAPGPGNAVWATSPDEARLRATREGKFVFFEFTKKECGNCKRMDAFLYSARDLEVLLTSMVPVKVDIESPLGKEFASRYGIERAPSILVVTTPGRLVFLMEGFYNPDEFFQNANSALEAYRRFAREIESDDVAKISAKRALETGRKLYEMSDPETALPRLRRAASAAGATVEQREEALELAAAAELDLGQPTASRKTIQQLLAATKDRGRRERAELFRAQIPLAEDRPAEALALFRRFQKEHPTSPDISRVNELVQQLEERVSKP